MKNIKALADNIVLGTLASILKKILMLLFVIVLFLFLWNVNYAQAIEIHKLEKVTSESSMLETQYFSLKVDAYSLSASSNFPDVRNVPVGGGLL